MSTAIEFNNISKQYRLGLVSTKTLSHDLKRWWTVNVRGKEDPYLKIGETNDRSIKGGSDYVWALKDINFKVEQGDVVGIIGKNGAGKSTLLKILSRVTGPTTGTIKAKGRIGSLLEVGTGFHPEMTGRENIYMNGAILGMTKSEIAGKLDEIVDFSGCERYIDTPVKRYSSGMMVRLGFAVAAHLDPEILVVDEVLAVGDAEFQKKAIGKMKDVSRGEGRTVLFVSHNMTAVKNLCEKGVILEKGCVKFTGSAEDAVHEYLGNNISEMIMYCEPNKNNRPFETNMFLEVMSVRLLNGHTDLAINEDIEVELIIKRNHAQQKVFTCEMMVEDIEDKMVGSFISPLLEIPENADTFSVRLRVGHHNLANGKYKLAFNIGYKVDAFGYTDYDLVYNVATFEIVYRDKNTKQPLSFWRYEWGSSRFTDAEISIE